MPVRAESTSGGGEEAESVKLRPLSAVQGGRRADYTPADTAASA